MHRLDLGLCSHPKGFGGMESEPMLTPREKSPIPENSPQRRIEAATQDSEPNTLPTELFRPHAGDLRIGTLLVGVTGPWLCTGLFQ